MPSLSLLSTMSIADSPGEAPVSVGTASWHDLLLRCRITLSKKPKFLQPYLTRRCRNKDNRNSGSAYVTHEAKVEEGGQNLGTLPFLFWRVSPRHPELARAGLRWGYTEFCPKTNFFFQISKLSDLTRRISHI